MKIGFDAKRITHNATGLGSYGRTLVNALADVAPDDCQLLLYTPDKGREELGRQVRLSDNMRFAYPQKKLPKWLWRSKGIVNDLQRDHIDIFHGLSGELPWGIRKAAIGSVVTIHDLIFLRHPEYYSRIDRLIYRRKFLQTVSEADRIIAISECTKRDIMHYADVEEAKISVVYQACSTFFKLREGEDKLQDVNARYMLPARYIVNVGTIEQRKNIMLAVKALRRLPQDIALVVVGRSTPYCDKVRGYIADNGIGQRVRILHGVPNDDLPAIYQMAEACVYPSRYEGFGIPIIEAIQSGLPVVACKGSCLEEAGGPDCLYVDPDDDEAMARAILQVLKGADGRDNRIAKAQQYITRFENSNVAQQVLDIYRQLIMDN